MRNERGRADGRLAKQTKHSREADKSPLVNRECNGNVTLCALFNVSETGYVIFSHVLRAIQVLMLRCDGTGTGGTGHSKEMESTHHGFAFMHV